MACKGLDKTKIKTYKKTPNGPLLCILMFANTLSILELSKFISLFVVKYKDQCRGQKAILIVQAYGSKALNYAGKRI